MIFRTIKHTGYHTFSRPYHGDPDFAAVHLDSEEWRQDINGPVATTFRQPERTAASWANRYEEFNEKRWIDSWRNYAELIREFNPIIFYCDDQILQHGHKFPTRSNQYKDVKGLHAALDRADMDYFYSIIDRGLINYAYSCI
jgi:hypothetical protein